MKLEQSAKPEDPIPSGYEEFIKKIEEMSGANPEEAVVAAVSASIVTYVAGRFGVDPTLITLGAVATIAAVPAGYRLARNELHYRKTGERKPFMTARERRLLQRAIGSMARVLVTLGQLLKNPLVTKVGTTLAILALLIGAPAPNMPIGKYPVQTEMVDRRPPPQTLKVLVIDRTARNIRVTGSMPQMGWSMGTRSTFDLT